MQYATYDGGDGGGTGGHYAEEIRMICLREWSVTVIEEHAQGGDEFGDGERKGMCASATPGTTSSACTPLSPGPLPLHFPLPVFVCLSLVFRTLSLI
jgi:hypothetical protein